MLCLSTCYPVCNAFFAAILSSRSGLLGRTLAIATLNFWAFTAKTVLAVVGFACDCGVVSADFSGYYAGQFLGTSFYIFYYRWVFEHVNDWSVFAVLQASHFALEWVKCVVRATDWYYQGARKLSSRGPQWYQAVVKTVFLSRQPNVSSDDWARFMAVETALEAFILVESWLAFLTFYIGARCVDSARPIYPSDAHMTDSEWTQRLDSLMLQLVVQGVMESLSIGLMELWFRYRLGGSGALRRFPLLYEQSPFFVFILAWCMVLGATPWIQFTAQQFCTDALPREHAGLLH